MYGTSYGPNMNALPRIPTIIFLLFIVNHLWKIKPKKMFELYVRITDGVGANPQCFIYSFWLSEEKFPSAVVCHELFEMIYCLIHRPRHRKVTSQSYIPYHQIHQHCNDKTNICHEQSQSVWFLRDLLILRECYSTSLNRSSTVSSTVINSQNESTESTYQWLPVSVNPQNTCVIDDKIFLRGGESLNNYIDHYNFSQRLWIIEIIYLIWWILQLLHVPHLQERLAVFGDVSFNVSWKILIIFDAPVSHPKWNLFAFLIRQTERESRARAG